MEYITYSFTKKETSEIPTTIIQALGEPEPLIIEQGKMKIYRETCIFFSCGDEISKLEIANKKETEITYWKYHSEYYFDLDDLLNHLPSYLLDVIFFNLDEFRSIL